MKYTYGHFNEDGSEFVITNPKTPRAFDNFLWNDALFSNVQQTGVGYIDYQVGDGEAIQMFTGIGRICDFDAFGRDHLMSRLVYVRDNETGEFWNVGWEPVRKPYESYECIHGLGYTIIRSTVNGVTAELRIFVPKGNDPVEIWTLRLSSSKPRSLSVFIYNQFQFKYKWGFDSYGDMIYRAAWFNAEHNAVVANKHPFQKPHNYLMAFVTSDRKITGFDGSRDAFVGTYNTLADPEAVVRGKCSNTPGSSDATIGAAQFDIDLKAGEDTVFSVLIGATDAEENIPGFRERYLGRVDEYFQELKKEKEGFRALNRVESPDEHFNRILNNWVKQATLYGATWCRWGYNGFRDIVQHGLGVAAMEPSRTRRILLDAFRHQYSSGLAVRGWNPIDEKAYSDSALWLVFTLVSYIKETGDTALLQEEVPFYDNGSATVLEHIEKALQFLENNKGAHRLCLIKYGDWNDSLTGVGKEGRGESVWLSQAYAEATRQMADLMRHLGEHEKEADYIRRREDIIDAINKEGWDGKWYTRCFDDSGRPIGSHTREFAKIFFEPQCWALISGVADEDRAKQLLESCDKELGTELGYLLLSPAFTKFDESIGRISSLEPGICENGTVYSHLNVWMVLGLLRYGMADRAYEVFQKIAPGYVRSEDDLKQKCPPFMFANCYYGPSHRNNRFQMEFTWATGSVAWFNTVLANEMIGVKPTFDGLVIDPCLPSSWETCSIHRSYRGAVYHVTIKNPDKVQRGTVEVVLDGKKLDGNKLPIGEKGREYQVDVTLRKS
jgi:cellobiose phosphorylase